jgi:hypothetical protein
MSHTGTVKLASLNKRAQSPLKPSCAAVVKTWEVIVQICHIPQLWKINIRNLEDTAKFKHEVAWCTEVKGNSEAAAIFGADESKHLTVGEIQVTISESEAS